MKVPDIPFVQGRNDYPDADNRKFGMAIHNTSNDATDTEEASYATRRTDGVSSHFYCLVPDTRIFYQDLTWRPIGDVQVGDQLIGLSEHPPGKGGRQLVESIVELVSRRTAECVKIELDDGRTVMCTWDHPWLANRIQSPDGKRRSRLSLRPSDRDLRSRKGYNWARVSELAVGDRLLAPLRPWGTDSSRSAGYLAALFDGEGCISNAARSMTFAQREGAVLDTAKQMLAEKGLEFYAQASRANGVTIITLSGLQASLELLGSIRPIRFDARRIWLNRSPKSRLYPNSLIIRSIQPVGVREVVSITTSSRTFFAEGIASHNCDNNSITQSLDTRSKAGHAGSGIGNENSISWEITGGNGMSRSWWLNNVAWDRMGKVMAYLIQNDPDFSGFQVRRATAREMQINPKIKAFYGHDDMRRAWGGTTHTDPGPNFPWDKLFSSVNKYLEGDVELTDLVTLGGWIPKRWPTGGTADGKLQVATILGSGYGHARGANEQSAETVKLAKANGAALAKMTSEVAELKGQIAGLIALVEQALTAPPVNLTPEQLGQLTNAVRVAAREPGERIEAALVAAGEALATVADADADT